MDTSAVRDAKHADGAGLCRHFRFVDAGHEGIDLMQIDYRRGGTAPGQTALRDQGGPAMHYVLIGISRRRRLDGAGIRQRRNA